jgi:hypothetical protein
MKNEPLPPGFTIRPHGSTVRVRQWGLWLRNLDGEELVIVAAYRTGAVQLARRLAGLLDGAR